MGFDRLLKTHLARQSPKIGVANLHLYSPGRNAFLFEFIGDIEGLFL